MDVILTKEWLYPQKCSCLSLVIHQERADISWTFHYSDTMVDLKREFLDSEIKRVQDGGGTTRRLHPQLNNVDFNTIFV